MVVFNGVRGGRRVALRDQREEQRRDFEKRCERRTDRGDGENARDVITGGVGDFNIRIHVVLGDVRDVRFHRRGRVRVALGDESAFDGEQHFSRRRGLADESVVIGRVSRVHRVHVIYVQPRRRVRESHPESSLRVRRQGARRRHRGREHH